MSVTGVFVLNALNPRFKIAPVDWSPPVFEISIAIKLRSLIIESVRDFVPNHNANATEIHSKCHVFTEEWWLQNARWKSDRVELGRVKCVHNCRPEKPSALGRGSY